MSEPTTGEVMRRLDQVSQQLVHLAQDMRDDRVAAAGTYVRKDVHQPMHDAHTRRIEALEAENAAREKAQGDLRRQLVVGLVLVAVPALVGLLIGVNRLLTTGATL